MKKIWKKEKSLIDQKFENKKWDKWQYNKVIEIFNWNN